MSRLSLLKSKKIIILLCFLSIGVFGVVYLLPVTSIISTDINEDPGASEQVLTKVIGDTSVKTNKLNSGEVDSELDLAAIIEKDKLDSVAKKETFKQLEQEAQALDLKADESIELLFKKSGTTKEEMKKRFAAILEKQ